MWYYDQLHEMCARKGITYHRSPSGTAWFINYRGVQWVAHSSKKLCEVLSFLLSVPK